MGAAKSKNYARAVEYYEAALKTIPKKQQPVVWANLAVAQLRLGRRRAGWRSFRHARGGQTGGAEVYLLYGQELYQLGRYQQAVKAFEDALRARPEHPTARRNLAIARRKAAEAEQP